MKNYFITGTDTGIGKTLTAAIVMQLLQANYWKPIQSRSADELSDTQIVQSLTGLPDTHFFSSAYEFYFPLSPNHAAEKSGVEIEMPQIKIPTSTRSLIVEGAGGVYVPLNTQTSMLDLMKWINFPVIIVCRGTLGTINHTLLTIEALHARNIQIHGLVFSGELNLMSQKTIEQWSGVRTLFHVPYFPEINPGILTTWLTQQGKTLYDNFTA